MKQKHYLFIALLAMMVQMAVASPVSLETAKHVGHRFMSENTQMKCLQTDDLQLVKIYRTENGTAAIYIFNTENGFVMISADDCAIPILGYSNESVFTGDDVPIQMEEYLQHFVEQIQYGIESQMVADERTARQWELVQATGNIAEIKGASVVTPLLTDAWNQDCYYNNLCPVDANGPCGHVYAGCAATAFSQILHYWGFPSQGTGSHSYTPEGYPTQTVDFGATTYQWSNMPNALTASSPSTQINAVATLMWHCGVAIDMGYGPYGSGAIPSNVATALTSYFNYSNDLSVVYKANYDNSTWLNLIKNCLDLGRPIHYSGWNADSSSGHGFVCDGYDSNNMLHFNWGWSGYYNNYYALDALTPGNDNYSYDNLAIINIHPNLPSYQVNISASPSNAGTVAFSDNANRATITYNFDDGSMTGWTSLDADGDGLGWVSSSNPGIYHNSGVNLSGTGHNSSEAYVISGSYANQTQQVLTPDNYLIATTKAAYTGISFWASSQDANYAAEHFGVAVSTTNTSASAFTTIQEWTMTAKGERSSGPRGNRDQGNWYQYNVDLSSYAGQDIWIAIRHFNCSDQFILNVDDITLTTGGGGGSSSASALYNQGQSCSVMATSNSGYYFANWTENGTVVSNSANYTFIVNGTRNLVANFTTQPAPQQYTITISANPSNGGSVFFNSKGSTDPDGITDGQWYYYDNGVNTDAIGTSGGNFWWGIMLPSGSFTGNTLTKVAAYDYMAMTGTASIYQGGTNAPAGAAIGTVNVTFTGSNQFVEFNFSNSVTINPQQNVWVVFYNGSGATYPAAVCANTGDANGRWVSLDGSTWEDLTSYGIDYTFMVRAYIEQGGSGGSSAVYNEGQTCTVVATPNSGYTFTGWKENGTTVSTNANYSFTVTGNRNLVANFSATPPPPQQYTISVSANPSSGGSVSGGGTYTQGQNCTVSASANSGYTFTNWTENGTQVSTNANYTFTVTGNRTLVANFSATPPPPQQYTISVSANPSNGGSVSGGGTYTQGQSCTVSASANSGYTFTNWTENGTQVSTNANYTFTVTGNRILVAHFAQNTYTIHASAGANGTITPSGTITVTHGANQSFAMIPDNGYIVQDVFIDGNSVGPMNSYSFTNVTADHYIHVTFVLLDGVEENNSISAVVYPNPTTGEVVIECERLQHLRIVNAFGQTVYNSDIEGDQIRIDLSNFAKGVYMMHIEAEAGRAIRKIVVE